MKTASGFWRRNWFLCGIALVLIVGLSAPGGGLLLSRLRLTGALTALILFLNGLSLAPQRLWDEIRNWRVILAALLLIYLASPLLAKLFAVTAYAGRPEMQLGLALLAAQGSTLASGIVITGVARGNTALALALALISNLLSAWFTPLVLWVWFRGATDGDFPLGALIGKMLLVVLLPVTLGQLLRWRRPALFQRPQKYFALLSQLCILLIMLTGVSGAAERVRADWAAAPLLIVTLALLHLLMFAIAAGTGRALRLDGPAARALAICSSQKTMPTGVYIAQTWFPSQPLAALPVIVHHLLQNVIDSVLAGRMARRKS